MSKPIDLFLSRLDNVQQTDRDHWSARCPAHSDNRPSLSIARGEDERVLIHCHAGCEHAAICEALGLEVSDLFPGKNGQAHSEKKIIACYDYVDINGNLLYQSVRYEPKTFRQRRPDPERPDAWIWNLANVPRVLYRLPEIRQAIADGTSIYVVEGEKDVENLRQQGLVATTNAGGAGKWRKEYCEHLQDANLVIIPDNDQSGEKHGETVATQCYENATSIKVLRLPDLPEKGDVSDWLETGGTVADLRALVDATPLWLPNRRSPTPSSGNHTLNPGPDPMEADDDPHRLARLFLNENYWHADGFTLRFWRSEWYQWDGARYRTIRTNELRAEVTRTTKAEMDRINVNQQQACSSGGIPPVRKVTQSLITNVVHALASESLLSEQVEPPSWLDDKETVPAEEILPCRNRLIHLPYLSSSFAEMEA